MILHDETHCVNHIMSECFWPPGDIHLIFPGIRKIICPADVSHEAVRAALSDFVVEAKAYLLGEDVIDPVLLDSLSYVTDHWDLNYLLEYEMDYPWEIPEKAPEPRTKSRFTEFLEMGSLGDEQVFATQAKRKYDEDALSDSEKPLRKRWRRLKPF